MAQPVLKIFPLLATGVRSVQQRSELFVLLSVFAGLLTSLIYTPTALALESFLAAMGEADPANANISVLTDLAVSKLPILLVGQVSLMAISGLLLPLWARAGSPNDILPWDGSTERYMRRAVLSFIMLVIAGLLTLAGLVAIGMIAAIIGAGSMSVMILVIAAIWLSVFFSAAANIAIIAASTDQKLSFRDALTRMQPFVRPIIGTLATIWFATILINAFVEPALKNAISGVPGVRAATFIHGALGFITSAFHISVLYQIPGIFKADSTA